MTTNIKFSSVSAHWYVCSIFLMSIDVRSKGSPTSWHLYASVNSTVIGSCNVCFLSDEKSILIFGELDLLCTQQNEICTYLQIMSYCTDTSCIVKKKWKKFGVCKLSFPKNVQGNLAMSQWYQIRILHCPKCKIWHQHYSRRTSLCDVIPKFNISLPLMAAIKEIERHLEL